MRKKLLVLCLTVLWTNVVISAQTPRDAQIAKAAEALRAKLIETRRYLHMHPELSNREEKTSQTIAEKLRALGFDEVKTRPWHHQFPDRSGGGGISHPACR